MLLKQPQANSLSLTILKCTTWFTIDLVSFNTYCRFISTAISYTFLFNLFIFFTFLFICLFIVNIEVQWCVSINYGLISSFVIVLNVESVHWPRRVGFLLTDILWNWCFVKFSSKVEDFFVPHIKFIKLLLISSIFQLTWKSNGELFPKSFFLFEFWVILRLFSQSSLE